MVKIRRRQREIWLGKGVSLLRSVNKWRIKRYFFFIIEFIIFSLPFAGIGITYTGSYDINCKTETSGWLVLVRFIQ